MCVGTDPLEFAIATNLVLETGFTNLQFIGLSAIAHDVGDRMFEKMVTSIQTDEARHAQIGHPVLATLIRHDPERAQYLVDKWFWRSWIAFEAAVVLGQLHRLARHLSPHGLCERLHLPRNAY
jgi:toluene monooxygenase system protein A